MLPNWIIIGAPKSSTSSLFRWLVDHPEVAGSADKETYYFVDSGTHMFRNDRNFLDHGLEGYEQFFAGADAAAKVIVEATPSYLYSATALRHLPKLPTKPHFIVVLREPVAQIRSLHAYFQQNWNWIPRDMGFGAFVAALKTGREDFKGNELARDALVNAHYAEHLRRWQAAAGKRRVHFLLFEALVADSRGVMRKLAKRMHIDPAFYDTYAFPAENSTYTARNAALQNLNIRFRGRMPQGALYRALRRIYRALNTRPAPRADSDAEAEQALSAIYADMPDELEREFRLDLTSWRAAMAKREMPAPVTPYDDVAHEAFSPDAAAVLVKQS
jgi:hypothetical protein